MVDKKTPTGFFQRSSRLVGMASKLASKQVRQRLSETFEKHKDKLDSSRLKTQMEQAKILTENLGQLKGAAMKAGQILSIDASDFLPPEVIEILSELQKKAAPTQYDDLHPIVEEDLSKEKLNRVEDFIVTPIASASIGQVHRAKIAGRDVVLKIQYPEIADSIDSDIRILKKIVQSFLKVFGKKFDIDATFEELKRVLKQEADYSKEMKFLARFNEFFSDQEEYIVPKPYPEFSSKRILTMSFEEGITIQEWLAENPSQEERNLVGQRFLNLFCQEFLDLGIVQTDPNFANFLIQPEGFKIVLLDFGASVFYDQEFKDMYQDLLVRFSSDNLDEVIACGEKYGFLDKRESLDTKKAFHTMMKNSFEPFQKDRQPFHFNDIDYVKRTREAARDFSRKLKYSAPPNQLLFLHRKLGGLFNLLKRIDARIDLNPYWKKMTGEIDT